MTPHASITRLARSLIATRSMCYRGSLWQLQNIEELYGRCRPRESVVVEHVMDRGVVSGSKAATPLFSSDPDKPHITTLYSKLLAPRNMPCKKWWESIPSDGEESRTNPSSGIDLNSDVRANQSMSYSTV